MERRFFARAFFCKGWVFARGGLLQGVVFCNGAKGVFLQYNEGRAMEQRGVFVRDGGMERRGNGTKGVFCN